MLYEVITQFDIKRVIAYSTLSQLGYMTVALGASAYAAGIFHLMTHAFFKRVDAQLTELTQLKEDIRVLVDRYKQLAADSKDGAAPERNNFV